MSPLQKVAIWHTVGMRNGEDHGHLFDSELAGLTPSLTAWFPSSCSAAASSGVKLFFFAVKVVGQSSNGKTLEI